MPWAAPGFVWAGFIRMVSWRPLHGHVRARPSRIRFSIMNPPWWWPLDNKPIIWIVEDDVSTQRMVAEHLKANGFLPVLFDTAEKAYAALRAQAAPSLILLDMLLPGMSGVDLIRLIKQNKDWEKIPVVVVSVLS